MNCAPADGDHVWAKVVPIPVAQEGIPIDTNWAPDHVRCLCGRVTWGEMNARLREGAA